MKASFATLLWLVIILVAFSQTSEVFLRERVSKTTTSGVVGFPPGTKAQVVGREGNKITIKIEDQSFDVTPDQITTDAESAHQLTEQDAARQSALQQQLSANQANPAQLQPRKEASPVSVNTGHDQVNARIAEIRKERDQLKIDLKDVKFDQKGLAKPNSKKYAWGHLKRFGSSPNAEKLENERKKLEQEIFDLDQEERRLKLEAK